MYSTSSIFYSAAALINLATTPKHFLVGQILISKSTSPTPASAELAKDKAVIKPTQDYATGSLLIVDRSNRIDSLVAT